MTATMTRSLSALGAIVLGVAACGVAPARVGAEEAGSWTVYRDDRFGLSFRYPAAVLGPAGRTAGTPGDTGILLSRDGRARLVVSAGLRPPTETLASYRTFLLERLYAGTRITFAPRHDDWFVLSGFRGTEIFYERVMFACGGRMILGFALTYPESQRDTYDRVVEGVARSFAPKPGQRCG